MKNDKQITFTELSFQPFSGKFVTVVEYPKPISWIVWIGMEKGNDRSETDNSSYSSLVKSKV